MRVIVVGAGIGGLATAVALGRRGHEVRLVERAPRFEAIGAGLLVAPNAVHALTSLGVDLAGVAMPLETLDLCDASGRLLGSVDLRRLAREFGPSYGVTRPTLHDALLAQVPTAVDVQLGSPVDGVMPDAGGVTVTSDEQAWRADLVVGADGLHSRVREITCGASKLRYAGETCWRGIAPVAAGARAVEHWGDGTRVGVFPMTPATSYYYLLRSVPEGASAPPWEELRRAFAAYGGLAGEVLAAIDTLPPLQHDLLELDRPVWGTERVILLGDAAHAMTPNVGQGAAMAIEDAIVLARVLDDGVAGALTRYRTLRERRVRGVQLLARRTGMATKVRGRVPTALRDRLMRAAPDRATERTWRAMIADGVALSRTT